MRKTPQRVLIGIVLIFSFFDCYSNQEKERFIARTIFSFQAFHLHSIVWKNFFQIDSTSNDTFNPTLSPTIDEENPILLNYLKKTSRNSSLLIGPRGYSSGRKTPKYKLGYMFDKEAGQVMLRDSIDNIELGIPLFFTLDDYLRRRQEFVKNSMWDSLVAQYKLDPKIKLSEMERMLDAVTGLTIPIPPSLGSIFGKPEVSVNVTGDVLVSAGWRWDTQNLGTASVFGQTISSPIFNQRIAVNVGAKIGDKLNLNTDWNSFRQIDLDNRFRIGFDGYDDDIIKRIEFGNVQLQTPSTFINGSQALWGIRADFQFGPLFLKSIASQRRGERRTLRFQGGSAKQHIILRAYDYSQNHFFLDTMYKSVYRAYFQNNTPVIPASAQALRVTQLEVYESSVDLTEVDAVNGVAQADLQPIGNGQLYPNATRYTPVEAGKVEWGRFRRLLADKYEFNPNLGTITINGMRRERTYAVAYAVSGLNAVDPSDDQIYGTLSNTLSGTNKDTVILKLVYRPNMQPGFRSIWSRQMRNIYPLSVTNINTTDSKVSVYYLSQNNDSSDVLEGAPDKLVTILRVDQVNNSSGASPPDGQFDLRPPFFNPQRGEIEFPSLEPFREELVNYFTRINNPALADKYIFPAVYDTIVEIAKLQTGRDRFVIGADVTGNSGSRISLGAFNLPPNSVKVVLDGTPLVENQDFRVDYGSGSVTLINPRATLPNANIQIEFESPDLLNLTTRTMLGVRGDIAILEKRSVNANLGFTWMNYDQALLQDRVQLGQEVVSNTMFGLDGNLRIDMPIITKSLNALPFFNTREKSSLTARGEWALMMPLPNKRISDVLSDNAKPVVYVDDFEGGLRTIPLSTSDRQWVHAAPPVDEEIGATPEERAKWRSRTFWWQYFVPRTPVNEVYPNRQFVQGQGNLRELNINFDPKIRGIYNKNEEFVDQLTPGYDSATFVDFKEKNRSKFWGGFQRLLSSFNTNFDLENIDYVDIMMNVEYADPSTRMYLDFGMITEDIIPNNTLDTEDGSTAESPLPNGIIDVGEDVGIDQLSDAQERESGAYPTSLSVDPDPARDNYVFNFSNASPNDQEQDEFLRYNNYEGNAIEENGQFPDTEILNRNNGQVISQDNSYFSYEINLDGDPARNPQIVGGNIPAGWRLYRIPIRGMRKQIGNPLFSNIQYVRVWWKGGELRARIVDWKFVGSLWQRVNPFQKGVAENDSVMTVAFVNREENNLAPDFYNLPPGVSPPRNLNNLDFNQDIRLNEQSLSIKVNQLQFGEERMAVRIWSLPLDFLFYKQLKFFLHGDGSMPDNFVAGSTPQAYGFIRFGTDSANFYEYRVPLTRGWQDLGINLETLAAFKQLRDSLQYFLRQEYRIPGDEKGVFVIQGNPVLQRVQFVGFGIGNPQQRFPNDLTTTMWVNELRLIEPQTSNDWAGVGSLDLKIADVGTINASWQKTNPNFHRLEERFGNRVETSTWNLSTQFALEKFLPKDFRETRIPFVYKRTEFTEDPRYLAQNDVNLIEAAKAAGDNALLNGATTEEAATLEQRVRTSSQTVRVQDNWAITGFRFGIPTKNWIVNSTLNALTLGYSYDQQFERTIVVEERFQWTWNFTGAYTINIPQIATFSPFSFLEGIPGLSAYSKTKFSLLPSNFSTTMSVRRSRVTEQSRFLSFASPVIRDFMTLQTAQFTWRIEENGFLNPVIDYNVTTGSTMMPFELENNIRQRQNSEILNSIFGGAGKPINLGTPTMHTQNITINFRPVLPNFFNINNYISTTGSFRTTYMWNDPLQQNQAISDVSKSAQFNNAIQVNSNIKLKSFIENMFGIKPVPANKKDTTDKSVINVIGNALKAVFVDYETFILNFNQNNTANTMGVMGGNGMTNFWARSPTFRENNPIWGPSFAYQMGLTSNPHGNLRFSPSSSFPIVGFETDLGIRPRNAVMQDVFSQRSTLEFRTSRPLWTGANLDLNWRSEFGFGRNQTLITDADGIPEISNKILTQQISRSYLMLPTIFFFPNNTVGRVVNLYQQERVLIVNTPGLDTLQKNALIQDALSTSFREGFESLNFFTSALRSIMPNINWTFRWDGLEKLPILKDYARRISLDHAYISRYTENVQVTNIGTIVQSQNVKMEFSPFLSLTLGFDEKKLGGNLTSTLRYNTSVEYSMFAASRATVQKTTTDDFSFQMSYNMRGLKFLMFDVANDLEFSFITNYKSRIGFTYDVNEFEGEDGRILNGTITFRIEPRIRYNISQVVQAQAFFIHESTTNKGAAQSGFSNTQFGVDIRMNISGGR